MSRFVFRNPDEKDVLKVMKLYQLSVDDIWRDKIMLDYKALKSAFETEKRNWLLIEDSGEIAGFAGFVVESEERLGKITRIFFGADYRDDAELIEALFANLISRNSDMLDILYMSTKYVSFVNLEIALKQGFKLLGFFPVSPSLEKAEINALAAYYYPGVLEKMRNPNLKTHPCAAAFLTSAFPALYSGKGSLSDNLQLSSLCSISDSESCYPEPVPELEMIEAPQLVQRKFQKLRELKLLNNNFYPFQRPNSLISDSNEKIRIFITLLRDFRFAAIIEENLEEYFNPSELYRKITRMLAARNINYTEMIVDAADISAINYMIESGFVPMVCFPALKKHGTYRRDYFIMGHSFERFDYFPKNLSERYPEFQSMYNVLEKSFK
ncbi:MAG: hypothetical protein HQM10_21715 [Candidatus Riflebacteria bacterium]|nr:hypothetical protein [Candidatus Riflebacteria bacterium]